MSDITLTADTSGAIRSIDRLESSIGDLQTRFSKLGQTVSGINGSFSKLGNSVNQVSQSMGPLKSAIAGLGIATFISQTITMADAMADLSDSTGIAINELIGFSDAVSLSGGNSAKAEKAVLKLVQNIGQAAEGSAELQKSFNSVNVSIKDLANLSEGDILKQTIAGLAGVDDAAKRSALTAKLLGEEFRNVSISQLNEMLGKTTAEASKSAKAFENAAKAQEKFDIAVNMMRKSVLIAIEPLTKLIAELKPEQIEKFVGKLEKINEIAKNFTGLFMAIDGLKLAFENLEESPGKVGAAFAAVVGVFVLLATKAGAIVSGIGTAFSNLVPMIVSFGGAIGRAFAGAMPIISKLIGALAAPLAILVTMNEAIKVAFKVDPIMDFWKGLVEITKYLGKVLGLYESVSGKKIEAAKVETPIIPEYSNEGRTGKRNYDFTAPEKGPKREVKVIDEFAKQKTALQEISKAYALQNMEMNTAAGLQKSLLMMSEDQREETTAIYELDKQRRALLNDLQGKLRDLSPEEAQAGLGKIILDQVKLVNEEYQKQLPIVRQSVTDLQAAKAIEQARLDIITQMVDAENRRNNVTAATNSAFSDLFKTIKDSKSEMELALLSPLERQREEIRKNGRLIEDEMVKKLTEAFTNEEGDIIDPEKLGAQINKARSMIDDLKNTQLGVLETSQSWSSGWDEAFKEYADSATSAAEQAKNVFQTATSEMESALSNFVKTGKLNFRDLAASIITSLTSKALTDAFKNLVVAGGNTEYGNMFKGGLSALFGASTAGTSLSQAAYAGISGYAEGGTPPVGKVSIVGEKGPELFVPKSAGTIIPNNMLGGSQPQSQPIVNNYYNSVTVSAVDSQDASRFIMANKSMIFAANETARRSIPGNQVRK